MMLLVLEKLCMLVIKWFMEVSQAKPNPSGLFSIIGILWIMMSLEI